MTRKINLLSFIDLRSGLVIPLRYLVPIWGFSLVYSYSLLRFLGYTTGVFFQTFIGLTWIVVFGLVFVYPKKVFLSVLVLGILGGLVVTLGYVQSADFRLGLDQWISREFILIQPDALVIPLTIIGGVTLLGFSMVFIQAPGLSLIPLVGWLGLLIFGLQTESIYVLPVDIPMGLLSSRMIFPLLLGSMGTWYLLVGHRRMVRLPQELQHSHQGFLWSTCTVAIIVALILPTNLPPVQIPEMPGFSFFTTGTELGDFGRFTRRGRGFSYDRQFIYYFAGEAQGNRLGGDLVQTSTVLVELDGLSDFYLRAIAHDTYTGFSWATSQEPQLMMEFPEPPSTLMPFLAQGQFTLIPRAIETRSVFTHGFPTEIRGLAFPLEIDVTHSFSQPLLIPSGSAYGITTQLITHRDRLSQTLLTSEPESFPQNVPYSMEQFLQLPDRSPERVAQLSQSITENYHHPYAQVTALVEYLRENFSYSETFPRLAADQDFVDYFLFEYQQGYCTAFASALALMARTIGIPTRYVVGFRVPPSQPGRTLVQVTGFHAHTWVEAYMPDVGWLAFEPTPGFDLPDLSSTDPRLTPIHLGNQLDDTLDSFQDQSADGISVLESDELVFIQLLGITLPLDQVFSTIQVLVFVGLVSIFGIVLLRILLQLLWVKGSIRSLIQELDHQSEALDSGKGFENGLDNTRDNDLNDETSHEQNLEAYMHRAIVAMKVALEYLEPSSFGLQPGETLSSYGRRANRDLGFTQDFDLLELTLQLDKLIYGDPLHNRSNDSKQMIDSGSLNHQLALFLQISLRTYKTERRLNQKWIDLVLPGRLRTRVYQLLISC